MAEDFYKILGIQRGASDADIQKAYRKLARKYHPDMNPDDRTAKEKFQAIQRAYDVLSDPEKRRLYDRYGSSFESAGHGGPTWQSYPGGAPEFREVDFSQFFGDAAGGTGGGTGGLGGLEDFLRQFTGGGMGGRRRTRQSQRARGSDLHHEVEVPFATSIVGGQVQLSVRRGDGIESITARIPAGIEDGKKIRLRGQGEPSPTGGPPGDLLITVHVAKHPFYRRRGNDLEVDVPVTLGEAARGAKIDLPTPKGVISLKVPPATSSGRRLRLKGLGVPTSNGQGDLYAQIQIVLPPHLGREALECLDRLESAYPHDPRSGLQW